MGASKDRLPKFNVGQVIHLGCKNGLPANIYIEMVYKKVGSTEWMYAVRSEAVTDISVVYISESILLKRLSHRSLPVYNKPFFQNMDKSGFRFNGNWDNIDDVINAGKELAKNPNIKNVVIHNARDYNGNKTDGYGLWIKWVNTIDDTWLKCDVTPQSPTMPIKIK